ncbi:hypothetical protein D3C78_883820 [compost metagenome]
MDNIKTILSIIIIVLIYMLVSSALEKLVNGNMVKLFDWSVKMYYLLILISFCISLYLDLISDRSFSVLLMYINVLINLVILLSLLICRWRLKIKDSITSYVRDKLMTLVIMSIVGIPILNIVLFIELFKKVYL